MTKTPGGMETPKQIARAQREAHGAFRQPDAATPMSEHEIAQAAFSKNRERLKAERLAQRGRGDNARESQAQGEKEIKTKPLIGLVATLCDERVCSVRPTEGR